MTNEIQVIEQNEIAIAFQNFTAKELFERVKSQATSVVFDLENPKDQKALKSQVYKIRQSKTAFDAHGKALKDQYTEITSKIDTERRFFKTECDQLIEDMLQPLVEIELKEKARIEKLNNRIQDIHAFTAIDFEDSQHVSKLITALKTITIDSSFQEKETEAKLAKFEAIEFLEKAYSELLEAERLAEEQRIQQEVENARLAKIEEEKRQAEKAEAERLQKEREERLQREATEKAQREAEEKARLEAERVEKEKQQAIERENQLKLEKQQAELRLEAEKEALKQKAINDALEAEKAQQRAIEAERQRIEREHAQAEAKKRAEEEAQRLAEEKRQANKAHQKRICSEILASLVEHGQSEESAKVLINLIHQGKIKHVSINY